MMHMHGLLANTDTAAMLRVVRSREGREKVYHFDKKKPIKRTETKVETTGGFSLPTLGLLQRHCTAPHPFTDTAGE